MTKRYEIVVRWPSGTVVVIPLGPLEAGEIAGTRVEEGDEVVLELRRVIWDGDGPPLIH